jgi:hypothetical protein
MVAQAGPAPVGAQASKGVHVCVGTDNVIRYTSSEKCPAGQQMYRLAEVEDEVGIAKEKDEPASTVVADLKSKIDFLTKRIANLEGEVGKGSDPGPVSQVKAPFEVVDKAGNPIFVVADGIHSAVTRKGRFEIARAADGTGFSLVVRSAAGRNLLGLGELSDGGGLFIADAAAVTRIFGSADGLKLYNTAKGTAVHLAVGSGGAGQFWLYDASGRTMVNAGTDGKVGVVNTGPNIMCAPQAGLRVGDCLRGRP